MASVTLRGRLARKFLSLYEPGCQVRLGRGEIGAVGTWLPRKTEAVENDLLVSFDDSLIDKFEGTVRRKMLLLRTAGRKEEAKREARRAARARGERDALGHDPEDEEEEEDDDED